MANTRGKPTPKIRVVKRREIQERDLTARIPFERQELFSSGDVWVGLARTLAGVDSGWHHHGNHDTYVYVLSGKARVEAGRGGRDALEIGPGDFAYIPARTIHREVGLGPGESVILVFRMGSGPLVFDQNGPEGP